MKNNKEIKLFEMIRENDESGVSGTGRVLLGIIFEDGQTVIKWCVKNMPNSLAIYPSFGAFELIHITSHPTNGTKINYFNLNELYD